MRWAVIAMSERVGLDPPDPDTDGGGLTDGTEANTHNTIPVWDDTNGDGLTDGAEVTTHTLDQLRPASDILSREENR